MAQQVKNLSARQETQETRVRSLGGEDPLEEETTHFWYACLENPQGQRALVGYGPWGRRE